MYEDVAVNDHQARWIMFLVQVAKHRYGIAPQKIIGIGSDTAVFSNDKDEVVGKAKLSYPLLSAMPVDTLRLPTMMVQASVDEPICLIYNEAELTAMMN